MKLKTCREISIEELEKGKLHSIVKLMWLLGATAAVLEFAYLASAGYMYEACMQVVICFMISYLWLRNYLA